MKEIGIAILIVLGFLATLVLAFWYDLIPVYIAP